ncbi:hypothetical protein [Nonomuraea roseoviolacea]|uniref:Membrane protein YhdT n=1 Tax=Nonomuraea roseoviolacea subsp. carminata TaxID=160689 RepID=A0ABT1K3W6_9ACTN|nr:hypothetical protein [Nonomuraea roseoviolacea]MCP2348688.1 putative membrane protein YhdT [Nonomuraea roseoviolacea subsp. carminata]
MSADGDGGENRRGSPAIATQVLTIAIAVVEGLVVLLARTIRWVLLLPLLVLRWLLDSEHLGTRYRQRLSGLILLAGYMSWVVGKFFDAAFADLTVYLQAMATSNDVWSIIYLPPKLSRQAGTPLWLHIAFSATLIVLVLWAFGTRRGALVLLLVYAAVVVLWNAAQAARTGGARAYVESISTMDDVYQRIYLPPKLSGHQGTPLWLHIAFSATLVVLALMMMFWDRLSRRSQAYRPH